MKILYIMMILLLVCHTVFILAIFIDVRRQICDHFYTNILYHTNYSTSATRSSNELMKVYSLETCIQNGEIEQDISAAVKMVIHSCREKTDSVICDTLTNFS